MRSEVSLALAEHVAGWVIMHLLILYVKITFTKSLYSLYSRFKVRIYNDGIKQHRDV
jgi:hypothetical protein